MILHSQEALLNVLLSLTLAEVSCYWSQKWDIKFWESDLHC